MIRKQCVRCECKLRPAKVSKAKAPGTRQHAANGLCKSCYYFDRKASGLLVKPVELVPVFDERLAASALACYLVERRRRLARQS